MTSQSRLSLLYYKRKITTTDGTDITSDAVSFAFVSRGAQPVTGDWKTATYLTGNVWGVLVGPGGSIALTAGNYDVWEKVVDTTEIPTERVDVLQIT